MTTYTDITTAGAKKDPPRWYAEALTTWPQILDAQVAKQGERTLLVFGETSISYRAFGAEVDRLAKGLIALGVRKGEVVGLWMTNSIDWVICQFAVYKTGAILLPLYSYYRQTELDYALKQAGVSTLIMADCFLGKLDARQIALDVIPELATASRQTFASAAFPALRRVILVGEGEVLPSRHPAAEVASHGAAGVSDAELAARQAEVTPFDVMNIMYTSGTTGFPKGGMSMHVTNLSTVGQWSRMAGLSEADVILCHVPLFTNFGGLYGAPLGIRNGCKVVITEQFDAALSLRLIEDQKVTYIPGTPSMFRMLLDHEDVAQRDLSSVRRGHVAGAPLTDSMMRDILDVLGAEDIMQAWGLSECGGLSTVSTKHDPREKRLKSVGKPLESALVRVMDAETRQPQPTGVPGEIWLGDRLPGSCVGKGYFGMPEKTAEAITPDGWFRTGDVGYFDEDGYLYITGRVDDMFTVGGFNVYPAEIENKLEKHPAIREAFIVPVPDHRLGAVPAAWISTQDGIEFDPAELIAQCRATMASQKVPRRIFFYQPGDLPLTPAGKLKKKELVARTVQMVEADATAGLIPAKEELQ